MKKRDKPKERPVCEPLYAVCSTQFCYDDIAFEWAAKADSEPTANASSKLLTCNVRATVAWNNGD